ADAAAKVAADAAAAAAAAASSSSEAPAMMAAESSSSSEAPAMMATESSSEAPAMAVAAEPKLPTTGLGFDTTEAAAGSAVEGMSYVGVWAEDAAGCALVDQPSGEKYAVITGATVRIGATGACYGNNQPLVDGKATLNVGCPSQGKSVSIDISMPTPENLVFNGSPPLVRCVP
ncbi:MAG: hypothetical protein ABL866_04115, partial [Devosia sp.]